METTSPSKHRTNNSITHYQLQNLEVANDTACIPEEQDVPGARVGEFTVDISIELAKCVISAGPLARFCIIHQLKSNVRSPEVYAFKRQFGPTCEERTLL